MAERRVSATEARVHFGELLDSVRQKMDVVYVERAGIPQVVIVPVGVWEAHRKMGDPWAEAARRMEEHWKFMAEERKAGRIKDVGPSTEEIIRTWREAPYE